MQKNQQSSRVQNSILNMRYGIILEGMIFVCGIVFPKMIINTYGSSVNGLSTTINQMLNLINLIQAGSMGASIFCMLKPVANQELKTVCSIVRETRKYYGKLGVVYVLLALLVLVLTVTKPYQNITVSQYVTAFLLLIVSGSFSFTIIPKYDTVFSSYQKRYLLSIGSIVEKIVYYGGIVFVIYSGFSFLGIYVCSVLGKVAQAVTYEILFRSNFTSLPLKLYQNKQKVPISIHNRGYLLATELSNQFVVFLPTVIIAYIFDFAHASVYSVYMLVVNSIAAIVNVVQLSVSPSFGNLVNTADDHKVAEVFKKIELAFTSVGTIIISCLILLFVPFADLYTVNIVDVAYHQEGLAMILTVYCFMYILRMPYYLVNNNCGMFRYTCIISVVSAVASSIIGYVACRSIDPYYVALGMAIYQMCSFATMRFVFKKRIPWMKYIGFNKMLIPLIACSGMCIFLRNKGMVQADSVLSWTITGILTAIGSILVLWAFSKILEPKMYVSIKNAIMMRFIKKKKEGKDND